MRDAYIKVNSFKAAGAEEIDPNTHPCRGDLRGRSGSLIMASKANPGKTIHYCQFRFLPRI